jgi:Tfp pilus assembly protein PilN
MKKVRIDFAPQSLRRALFHAPRGAWVLLPLVVILGINLFATGVNYRDEVAAVERLRAQGQARSGQAAALARVAAPVRAPVPEAQAAAVNAAVMQLNLPWRGLHDAIQAATPAGIALLALEPDARKRSVRITAEAKNSDDMFAYVGQLQRIDWFDSVLLARHEINEQDPNRPIRFQIDARWRPAP